jgi:hypothetical protein
MTHLKTFNLRLALIALISLIFLFNPGCSHSKEISFIPIPSYCNRIGPLDVPLDKNSQDILLQFLEKRGTRSLNSAEKSKKAKLVELTKPAELDNYRSLLKELANETVITDIRLRAKGNEEVVSQRFSKWFKKPFIKDLIDSRKGDPIFEKDADCNKKVAVDHVLTIAISDGTYWWIFYYDLSDGEKIKKLMVAKLPEF